MRSNRSVIYTLPGSSESEFWEFSVGKGVGEKKKRGLTGPTVHCFGADEVFAVPLWISSANPDMVRDLVKMQLENQKVGNLSSAFGCAFDYLPVVGTSNKSQVLGILLSGDTADYPPVSVLKGFDISARFYPFAENGAALWKENSKYVFAVNRRGKLAYFQVLSSRSIDEDMASEIVCIQSRLKGADFIENIENLAIFDVTATGDEIDLLEKITGLRTQVELQPPPELSGLPLKLMPGSVDAAKNREKSRQKMWNLLFAGMLVYLAIIAVVLWGIFNTQKKIDAENQWIYSFRNESNEIRENMERWDALQPAIDKNYYPLHNLSKIIKALPGEDVRLDSYSTDLQKISITGQASNVNAAITWRSELFSDPAFEGYTWKFPQPSIKADQSATFRADGTKE